MKEKKDKNQIFIDTIICACLMLIVFVLGVATPSNRVVSMVCVMICGMSFGFNLAMNLIDKD